jgi:septal ring factor EnvC (AmiA/AmiB activator)
MKPWINCFHFFFLVETIVELTCKLNACEEKIKDLENTIRLQEQNIKAKDGSINKQKTSLEKLKNEVKEKTSDLSEKIKLIEKLESDAEAKEVCVVSIN